MSCAVLTEGVQSSLVWYLSAIWCSIYSNADEVVAANSWRHMYSWRSILPFGFCSSWTSSHTSTADCQMVS